MGEDRFIANGDNEEIELGRGADKGVGGGPALLDKEFTIALTLLRGTSIDDSVVVASTTSFSSLVKA